MQSSFPVIHKVGNADNFVLSKFANKQDGAIDHFNYLSKHYEQCKFAFKIFRLLTVSNLFALKVVQSCQHCQLCVLRKNSTRV